MYGKEIGYRMRVLFSGRPYAGKGKCANREAGGAMALKHPPPALFPA
jgi:hypothetical protein